MNAERPSCFPDNIPEFLDRIFIPRQRVSLRVVKQVSRVGVADVVEGQ